MWVDLVVSSVLRVIGTEFERMIGHICSWGQVICHCKPSLFAYPPKLTTESHKESVKMAAAVLSTTARKARKKEAAAKKSAEKAASKKAAEKTQLSGVPRLRCQQHCVYSISTSKVSESCEQEADVMPWIWLYLGAACLHLCPSRATYFCFVPHSLCNLPVGKARF